MKSASNGKRTSAVEVANITKHGLWLLIGEQEHFLAFDRFPWFRSAPVGQILNVELPMPHHLYWPELDIDLAVESITHPERFPLVSKAPLRSPRRPIRKSATRGRTKARPSRKK